MFAIPHALKPCLVGFSQLSSWALAWLAYAPHLSLCVEAAAVAEVHLVGAVVPLDHEHVVAIVYPP